MEHSIIEESSADLHRRITAIVIIGISFLVGGYILGKHLISGGSMPSLGTENVTVTSLFIMSSIGGLFFVPIPIEVLFTVGLRAGNPPLLSMIAAISGFLIGNIISYLIGWKLFRIVISLVPAKKLHGVRAKMIKWGAWAILIFNAVPLPSPLLTFALGIARYNVTRLFALLILGNIIKYTVIIYVNGGFI